MSATAGGADAVRPRPYRRSAHARRHPGRSNAATTPRCKALAEALELGEITASILVRRGYADVEAGAPFRRRRDRAARPVPARRHGRGGRADPRRDRRRQADLRPRRLRRRRHLRHRARRPDAARARRRRRLAPAEPLRGGLRRLGRRRSRGSPTRAARSLLTVDCGITAVEEVAAREGARPRRDRHRPPPARRGAARLPDRRDAAVRLSVPGALRHRRRLQARAGALGVDVRAVTSTSSRSRRSPTSSRSLDENRSLAIAGLRALARTQRARPAGADAERARSIRRPSTPPRSASASRRGSTPPAGSAAPTPRSSCC